MAESRITRFITTEGEYNFTNVIDWSTTFGRLQMQTVDLASSDGGFDQYGQARANKAIGQVQVTVGIRALTDAEASQKTDELLQMASWSKGRLYAQPVDSSLEERWCNARIKVVPHENSNHKDYLRTVQLSFDVDFPYWLTTGTYGSLWDEALWDEALWDAPIVQACSGLQTDFTITRTGTAPVTPTIQIDVGTGETVTNITIQRLVDGVVEDEVAWAAAMSAGDTLIIDAWKWEVLLNGSDAYDASFSWRRLRWLELQPGSNDIRVILGDAGDACTVNFSFFEAWN